jgi:hypothetical protein
VVFEAICDFSFVAENSAKEEYNMQEHLSLISIKNTKNSKLAKGLAPVVCYDPWFPRTLESIKQSIHDGHPVLIRLHSAASYPINSTERYILDLESHAVLIVGYDDAKQAVALIDPWDMSWGGNLGGRWWLPYTVLETKTVNTSLGMSMPLAPLEVDSKAQWDNAGNLSIKLQIGFYIPRGTVMDRDSWAISRVNVNCELPESWEAKQIDYEVVGHWIVGDTINLSLPVAHRPKNDGEINISVNALIQGKRPYDFEDNISVHEKLFVKVAQSEMIAEQTCKLA